MIGLGDLAGTWTLSREIEDWRDGHSGRLEGEATWRPVAGGLVQEERGRLRYGEGPEMTAHRRYLWRAQGDGIAVLFEDGRPFHRLGPGQFSATHVCPPDRYVVRYAFDGASAFTTLWRVTGPRKDLLIRSSYRKLS